MRPHATLSTAQWAVLQRLFDEALDADAAQRATLLQRANTDDARVGEALAAMLDAHARWEGRTGDAIGDWRTQASDVATLAAGTQVGPYRIVDKLGAGGMGVVYRAERVDGAVTQAAAIKVLRSGVLDADSRERFRRERDLLARFSHPHIARLFDAGVTGDGQPYFVMEYVRGTGITQYCDEQRLGIDARLQLFLKVCDAVRYAHRQLVLHRDIKPSNVLIDEQGVPKLIDFGIAKPLLLDAANVATLTQQRFFSPLNAAPEQLQGEAMGVACDVYQLGALLYELLCGRPILDLEGKSPGAIEEAIRQQIPLRPSARNEANDVAIAQARHCGDVRALQRQLRGDPDEIALLALRKEPERRYASVEQLMEDIERHLQALPVRARGSDRGYRAGRFVKRHWRSLGVAAAAIVATGAFIAMLTTQSERLRTERNRAVQEETRAGKATQFLTSVFRAADPNESLKRDTSIGEVLENGRRRIDSELAGQPQLQADLLYAYADIYSHIDQFDQAKAFAQQALALRQGQETTKVAESQAQLAIIQAEAGDCEHALGSGNAALAQLQRNGAGAARTRDLQFALIGCESHTKGNEYARDRMVAVLQALQNDPEATPALIAQHEDQTADYFDLLDNTPETLRLTKSAMDRLDNAVWKDTTAAVATRRQYANALSRHGKFEEAIALFDRVIEDCARIYGKDSTQYALAVTDRGATRFDMGSYPEVEADYLAAKKIYDARRPDPHPDRAAADQNLALLYHYGLKDLQRAGPYYDEAERMAIATWGATDANAQSFRANKAFWLAEVGRKDEAWQALETLRNEIPADTAKGVEVRITLAEISTFRKQYATARERLDECTAAIEKKPPLGRYGEQVKAMLDALPH
jgi:serine/threonine-protein kinase